MKRYWLMLIAISMLFTSCFDDDFFQHENTYQGNLDALWEIIDERYCYLDYKGIDWLSIKQEYDAKLSTVNNSVELFDLFAEMLDNLKDGHVNLTSSFDRSRYWKWYTDYPANYSSSIIFGKDSKYLGEKYRIAGGFRYGTIDSGKIGYMYYGDFSAAFSNTNVDRIFSAFTECEALIIDVRNNGGGSLSYSEGLASYFFTKEKVTGYIRHKAGKGHSDFSDFKEMRTPSNKLLKWNGRPVAVLTNRMSYSATNDFVNRMKNAPNTIIVGDKTGGGGGLPMSSELPIGWSIRFSAAPMYDINKMDTEFGIDPDYKVDMNPADMTSDAIIEKAIEELRKM